MKYCAARFGFLKVGCERWLASFQGLTTLTCGQRLRNALNAFVYSLTLGSLQGLAGHLDPSAAVKLISGSTRAACACPTQMSSQTASFFFSATFQEGK